MQRDDRVIAGHGICTVGTLHDWQAKKDRVGKQRAKSDGNTVFPVAFEQQSPAHDAKHKADRRTCKKAEQQAWVKRGREV